MESAEHGPPNLQHWFGDIDIYLFDQLLKGRLTHGMSVLDAGCGTGRNLRYFLAAGYDAYGVDSSQESITKVRQMAARLAPGLPLENFRAEPIESMSFQGARFDAVVCNAALHFAADEAHFRAMLHGMWRVLRPGGLFFARLATLTGMTDEATCVEGRHYLLPDGSQRFLADDAWLEELTTLLGALPVEPVKTVIVPHTRSMATWCLRKVS